MNIVCTGSIAYDYLMTFPGFFRDHLLADRLEQVSLSFLVDSMVRQRGGTAANIAYTLALLGGHPHLMATAGEDFGEYRQWLEAHGVDTHLVKVVEGKFTASFFANTDRSNAQIASFYAGAMADAAHLSIHDLGGDRPDLVVISPNDPGAMLKYAVECQEMGIDYLFDPSQQIVRMPGEDIRRGVEGAAMLFVNEYEYDLLLKHTGLTEERILDRVRLMVVTCGERGADIYAGGAKTCIPVVTPGEILDPTGVGDAFRGGFLTGYRLGLDWETCGKMGALAATYCLEEKGTQNHAYTLAEYLQRYQESFGESGPVEQLLSQAGG